MKAITLLLSLILLTLSTNAEAKNKITSVNYSKENNFGVVRIDLKNKYKEIPELTIRDNTVQVEVPNSIVWPKIEKQFSLHKSFDSQLLAYQFNKNLVRVRAVLPYSIKGKEDRVSIVQEDTYLKMYFPLEQSTTSAIRKTITKKDSEEASKIAAKKTANTNYDESYLEKLLKDKTEIKAEPKKQEVTNSNESFLKEVLKDNVSTKSAANVKESSNTFDMSSYVFKFIGFFALLIGGVYLLLNLFRKGMLKRSGLGFFSNAKMVEVLSTTYIAPKRSILVLRVHEQVFLVAQSEKGMDFLTEIEDTTAFIKEGEKQIIGNNFDTNLLSAGEKNKEFKLKELVTGNEEKVEISNQAVKEKKENSLSSQIKNKIKDLKQLQ